MRSIALLVSSLCVLQASALADDSNLVKKLADNKFAPNPLLPECVVGAAVKGDPTAGAFTLVLKAKTGCKVPMHWHTANEEVLIAGGNATMEMRDMAPVKLTAGGYAYLPSKHLHQLTCTNACTVFVVSDGAFDIHYVDADGKEISKEEALAKKPVQARRPVK